MTATPSTAELDVHRLGVGDVGFVVATWEEQHRKGTRMVWPAYKKLHAPIVRHLVNREDVRLLGAYQGDRILGWLAWTPGRLPAVHFAYVRGHERQRGIFTRLLDESGIGNRMVHTHVGSLPTKATKATPTRDKVILRALAKRGVYSSYVDIEQWLEANP